MIFEYQKDFQNLKLLRKKIYKKQKKLLIHMYLNNINFQDKSIKQNINEINLLEEIYDCKLNYFQYEKKKFWDQAK